MFFFFTINNKKGTINELFTESGITFNITEKSPTNQFKLVLLCFSFDAIVVGSTAMNYNLVS